MVIKMNTSYEQRVVPLSSDVSIWDQVFTVAPLVIIGTKEAGGSYNHAPKHLATPLSWTNHFGFVCTPNHSTYHNIKREGVFTVSYPRPTQMIQASLTSAPREDDNSKPALDLMSTFPAKKIDGTFIDDGYLYFECELERIIDGFDTNSLIAGTIIAAYAAQDSLRGPDIDDADLLADAPLLAYLNWGRFARIQKSFTFPFMRGFKR